MDTPDIKKNEVATKCHWVRVEESLGHMVVYQDLNHPGVFRMEDPSAPKADEAPRTIRHGHHHRDVVRGLQAGNI